jgi:site-specific DNA recombinase
MCESARSRIRYRMLNNRVYRGLAVHKGKAYPGEHTAIIDERLRDQVHDIFGESPRKRANNTRTQTPALLKGLIFTATGAAMTPSSTKKGTRRYRYCLSMDLLKNRETPEDGIPRRLPADTAEGAVITEIRRVLRTPETTAQVVAKLDRDNIPEADAIAAFQQFPQLWDQLFPAEQARLIQILVRRVTVTAEGLVIDMRTDGIAGAPCVREVVRCSTFPLFYRWAG